jgi:hypothetical protein
MQDVEKEYAMFLRIQQGIPAFPIASTGGAAARLFDSNAALQREHPELRDELSYLTIMRSLINTPRSTS